MPSAPAAAPTSPLPGPDDEPDRRRFVLELGKGLHACGYPAHRLEEALRLISQRLGLTAQFFSLPTGLFASFGGDEAPRSYQLRIAPGDLSLEKLARLERVAREVARGMLPVSEGTRRIAEVIAAPIGYGPAATTLCFALASASAARFLGGGARELLVAFGIGIGIGLLAVMAVRIGTLGRLFEPLAATGAGLLATLAAAWLGGFSVYVATLAGLIVLVPGFTLTVAMTELATRNLVSGTSRLVGAAGTFLAIGIGVALGSRLGGWLVGSPARVLPVPLPGWTEVLALGVSPLALTVLLRARPRDAGWVLAGGVLAFTGARAGAALLGPELGAFAGALLLCLASNAHTRFVEHSASIPLVPGLLLLVPGSLGFRSLSSLLERELLPGLEAAFQMTLVAAALATGLLVANTLLPARELLPESSGAGRG